MTDNKIAAWLEKYGGMLIGIIIGIIILNFSFLYEFFKFILVVGVCAWAGNYFQKNKSHIKSWLKNVIDKM